MTRLGKIKRLTERHPTLFRAIALWGIYLTWILLFRLLSLTFVTYFVTSSASAGARLFDHANVGTFDDVNETYGSIEIGLMATGAFVFVILLKILNPLPAIPWSKKRQEFFTAERLQREFLPGAALGAIFSAAVIGIFLLSSIYRYLGFFIQVDEAPLASLGLIMRILSLGTLAFFEEFLFRQRLFRNIRADAANHLPAKVADLVAVLVTTLLYVLIKICQFDLSWMQVATLACVSIWLSVRMIAHRDFLGGAGFWAATLITFHAIFSLSVFGTEFSGLLLLKYEAAGETFRLFSGGNGGPLSGLAFAFVLILDSVRVFNKNKSPRVLGASTPFDKKTLSPAESKS